MNLKNKLKKKKKKKKKKGGYEGKAHEIMSEFDRRGCAVPWLQTLIHS
jgi:hypothetical protein